MGKPKLFYFLVESFVEEPRKEKKSIYLP